MKSKILNEDICKQNGLSFKEAMMLYILSEDNMPNGTISSLAKKRIIQKQNNLFIVNPIWIEVIQNIIKSHKENTTISEEDLDVLVTNLQGLFPKERKTDEHGVPKYSFRGNKMDVKQRLKKFLQLYKRTNEDGELENYTLDEIYEATKRYVDKYKTDKTYMMLLPYFIFKNNESTLATELENDCNTSVDTTSYCNNLELI